MRYSLAMATSLAIFWLINSGHYTPLLLGFGVLSVALVTWISHRMDVVDHESQPLNLLLRIPGYWAWLAWQIVLSNVDVIRRIWSPTLSIQSQVRSLPLPLESDMTRVVYANSINLTPGTLTIELNGDRILVHGLTAAALDSLEDGDMARRVAAVEAS